MAAVIPPGGTHQVTDDATSAGISIDIKEGSWLQKGITTLYQDAAVRRGIIDGKHTLNWLGDSSVLHDQLQRAILVILSQPGLIIHGLGPTGELGHPFAVPFIPLERIRVWRWGPHAYFELHYRHTATTLLPVPAATTATWEAVFDHSISYRRAILSLGGFLQFNYFKGLPFGDLDLPSDTAGIFDEGNRPKGTVYKRAAQRLTIRTILNIHPHESNPQVMLGDPNKINLANFGVFGDFQLPFLLSPFTIRFDGALVNWIGESRWAVTYQFTFVPAGHWRMKVVYGTGDPDGGGNQQPHWFTVFERAHDGGFWDGTSFPVAI